MKPDNIGPGHVYGVDIRAGYSCRHLFHSTLTGSLEVPVPMRPCEGKGSVKRLSDPQSFTSPIVDAPIIFERNSRKPSSMPGIASHAEPHGHDGACAFRILANPSHAPTSARQCEQSRKRSGQRQKTPAASTRCPAAF